MEKKLPDCWTARWIAPDDSPSRHPILFRSFSCRVPLKSALLFVTGLGLFEAYLNGKKLGNEVLSPGFDLYDRQIQVLCFDVTAQLKPDNRLELWLGNGWYKGRFGMLPQENRWGSEFCAIAQLELVFAGGRTETLVTDEAWRWKLSPICKSGIYDGETQNLTLNLQEPRPVRILDWGTDLLRPRCSPPLAVVERLPVRDVLHTPAGETVLDFGQNFAGWVELSASFPKGTVLELKFGEILVDGRFYQENYRSAQAGFTVVCDGAARVYRPHFTYFGFRYVKVSGWIGGLTGAEFTGCVVHSDLPRTGWFQCGNGALDRLYQNIWWSQRSNFFDVPTDCAFYIRKVDYQLKCGFSKPLHYGC